VIEADDVIRFLERDGPFLAAVAAVVALGIMSLSRILRSFQQSGQERLGLFVVSSLQLWLFFLAFLSYVYWARVVVAGQPVEASLREFGLTSPIAASDLVVWSTALFVAFVVIASLSSLLQKALGIASTQTSQMMQPKTAGELAVWSLLMAPTAGICEELFFRGYAVSYLMRSQEEWIAIAVPSLAFGLLHFAQGPMGIVASGVMAATAATVFVATGSIWPPIIAHAVYNIIAPFLFKDESQENRKSA
jgi:membrane protease YdiL (CAAX protease family)